MHQNRSHEATESVEPESDERPAVYTRHPADWRRIVEAVALYPKRDELFRNYPELDPDDLRQALAFGAAICWP
jgi:hypothetical protein